MTQPEMPEHGITPAVVAAESGDDAPTVTQKTIDMAVDTVRGLVGWHVWPLRQEHVTVDGTGDRIIFLPTKRLVEVQEVIVDGATLDPNDVHASADGIIELPRIPRQRFGNITVTMRHGYDEAPNLRSVCIQIAKRASRPQTGYNVGGISVSAPGAMAPQSTEWRTIDLYKLGPMP